MMKKHITLTVFSHRFDSFSNSHEKKGRSSLERKIVYLYIKSKYRKIWYEDVLLLIEI